METIGLFKPFVPDDAYELLKRAQLSEAVLSGQCALEFEEKFKTWVGCGDALAVNSCTSALLLALRLSGVGPGGEVLTPALTCRAGVLPILTLGAKPVWVDSDPLTGGLDPRDAESKLSPRTQAIVAVHWGGYPCALDEIRTLAARRGLKVVEDAAHALGAASGGKKIGNHSDFVCFSFGSKLVTTGDGGVLICRDPGDARRARRLRFLGTADDEIPESGAAPEVGYKVGMNAVAATLGLAQIAHLDRIVGRHRDNAAYYDRELGGLEGIRLPDPGPGRSPAYLFYTFLTEQRDGLTEFLRSRGIAAARTGNSPLHKDPFFREFYRDLPNLERFSRRAVSVPSGWWVTPADRERIARAILKFLRDGQAAR